MASSGRATDTPPVRVTCFALPIAGHVMPLLPVVGELKRRGAEVRVIVDTAFAPQFREVGAEVAATYPDAFAEAIRRPSDDFLVVAAMLATWTTQALLDQADRVLEETAPDVVLIDSMCPWGRLAAQRRGIPVVTSTSSFLVSARLGASPRVVAGVLRRGGQAARALAAVHRSRRTLRSGFGVDCGGPLRLLSNRGDDTLVHTSRNFHPRGDRFGADVHFVGPTAAGRLARVPPLGSPVAGALADTGGQPIAYVALGTIYNDRPAFLRSAAVALSGLGYRVIVDLGRTSDPDTLEPLPSGVTCVRDAPQLAILDRTSLFVTHGGLGSVHEALWRGVPMIVFPQAADQPIVAARLEALGAGCVLRDREPAATTIAAAARDVRLQGRAVVADRLGSELRATGGAIAAADVVVARAGERQGLHPAA